MSILNKSSITGAGLALTILGTGGTAHAIVVYDESVNALVEPFDFTGVAFLEIGSSFCSGSLLTGGLHILTAAHCFMNQNGQFDLNVVGQTRAIFNLSNESPFTNQPILEAITVSDFFVFPEFDILFSVEGDLAILKLAKPASSRIEQYDIYRETDEIGQDFTIVGYGDTGIGSEGFEPELFDERKRFGQNRFDAFIDIFKGDSQLPGYFIPKTEKSLLLFDFDNGKPENDAFGVHFGIHDLGLGNQEVSPGPGDSGGPSFLLNEEGKKLIAGITSFGFSDRLDFGGDGIIDVNLFPGNPSTDVVFNPKASSVFGANANFGEFAGVTRVSTYASFIDDVVAGKVRPTASVPEPSSILGTFILGTWGASTLLRRKNKQ